MLTATNDQANSTFPANPFVGLRPFNSNESLLFFGRQEQSAELLQKPHRTCFLGIVGSSGCGKSSLIRAGLIPKLKAGFMVGERSRWRIADMKPGAAPLRNLAVALLESVAARPGATAALKANAHLDEAEVATLVKALRRTGISAAIERLKPTLTEANANLLLLVDQFEELFQFGIESNDPEKRDEAADFVSIMLELAEQLKLPIYVVITMRSDFLGECDNFYGLPEALNRSQYLVPRLTRQQRQQAIEGPIQLFGQKITPRLVDRVLNEMGGHSDQLPVMQHALMRTWDNWQASGDPMLDSWHYDEAGKLDGALSQDANAAMEGMSPEDERVTQLMFQTLTNVDARNRLVRRPTKLSELQQITGADEDKLRQIIKRFSENRRWFLYLEDEALTADPRVNISHESLIRQWTKMQKWLKDEAISRDIYTRLADEAKRYETDQAVGRLWRDPELEQALQWYHERRKPNAAWAQRYHMGFTGAVAFLEQSRLAREAQIAKDAADAEKEAQQQRELKQSAHKLAVRNRALKLALLIVLGLVGISWWKAVEAREQTVKAQQEEAKAREQELKAKREEAISRDLRLVAEKAKDELIIKDERLQNFAAAQQEAQEKLDKAAVDLQANLDMQQAAMAALTKAETDRKQAEAALHDAELRAKATQEQAQKIEEAAKKQQAMAQAAIKELENRSRASDEQKSHDMAAYADSLRQSQNAVGSYEKLNPSALMAAYSLFPLSEWGEAFKDKALGYLKSSAGGAPATDAVASNNPTSKYSLTYYAHKAAYPLLLTLTPRELARDIKIDNVLVQRDAPSPTVFSQDGSRLAVFASDGTVRVVNANTGVVLQQTARMSADVHKLAFSQDGQYLLTAQADREKGSAQLWQLGKGTEAQAGFAAKYKETALLGSEKALALSPDHARVIIAGPGSLRVWLTDKAEPKELQPQKRPPDAKWPPELISAAAFSPDGKLLVLGGGDKDKLKRNGPRPDNAIYLLDATNYNLVGKELTQDEDCTCTVKSLAFDPSSKYLMVGLYVYDTRDAREYSRVQIWNLATRKRVSNFTDGAELLAFSKNRKYLAMAAGDKAIRVIKADLGTVTTNSGEQVERLVALETIRIAHDDPVAALIFSDDESRLTAISDKGAIQVWKTSNQPETRRLTLPDKVKGQALPPDVVFNAAGNLLATVDGRTLSKLEPKTGQASALPLTQAFPEGETLDSFQFSPDGKYLVLAITKGKLRLVDISAPGTGGSSTETQIPSLANAKFKIRAISPHGKYLVVEEEKDKKKAVRVISTGLNGSLQAEAFNLSLPEASAGFAFNPAETKLVAVVKSDPNLSAKDAANVSLAAEVGEWMEMWDLNGSPSTAAAAKPTTWKIAKDGETKTIVFSSAGDYLALARRVNGRYTIQLHSLDGQQHFKDGLQDIEEVRSLSFDHERRRLLLATGDEIEIWDLDWNNQPQAAKKVAALSQRAYKAVFDKDGHYLAVAADNRVSLIAWRADTLVDELCARAGRNLALDEWREYVDKDDTKYVKACPQLPVHPSLIEQAIKLARAEGPESKKQAIALFAQIGHRLPDKKLEPEVEVAWHAQAKGADKKLDKIGDLMDQISVSLSRMQAALSQQAQDKSRLIAQEEEINTFLEEAISLYEDARQFYLHNPSVYGQPEAQAKGAIFPSRYGDKLNSLCWWGSLHDRADKVLDACRQSVAMDELNGARRDSLGVARALIAKKPPDFDLAIADLSFFNQWTNNAMHQDRRVCWIEDLQKGQIFPDAATKERLRQELLYEHANEKLMVRCAYKKAVAAKP